MSSNSTGNLPGSFLPSRPIAVTATSWTLGDVKVEVTGKVQWQTGQGCTQRNLGRSRSQQNFSKQPIFRKKEQQRLKTHNHDDDDDQDNNTDDETRRQRWWWRRLRAMLSCAVEGLDVAQVGPAEGHGGPHGRELWRSWPRRSAAGVPEVRRGQRDVVVVLETPLFPEI